MGRLTQEAQIGLFASLRDKAEAKPRAFNDYDCFLAHARAVTALKAYEDICFDEDGKERITIDELSALVKARDEGRVHIAPISNGTAIFYHIDDDENMFPEVEDGIFEGIYVNGYTEYICGEMGVGWFLTRAEAEAAIGGGGSG